ncbi:hypothetical protein [Sedimentisphaera salicampi]|uniref:Lipoprotein n=1 Tax=Sedimentisphaera salicampi TaxID=1941349 RepID=A0A1W6LLJ6_9BACT|nr:hypothetical protein [Sedimentisphaera salicampi]ARN56635.1 hypothetical protein STSP1_01022 [Sedimentisphaera salicampi]OXU15525.1 hypothetical protein SMSP1_01010 [Sedimentisphaera salicampi]
MTRALILITAFLVLLGCENHYTVVTEQGTIDLPLSKAIANAETEQELWNLHSRAVDEGDKKRIEEYIQKQYNHNPEQLEKRELNASSEYLKKQNKRRMDYVKSHFLSKDMKELILQGSYKKGMTKEQFKASRGEPTNINEFENDQGEMFEVWTEGLFNERKFYFKNGKLEFWD